MKKPTKHCELTIHLQGGSAIKGSFHVPETTAADVRPSDAIRDARDDGLLLLADATVTEGSQKRRLQAILIHLSAVAYIELPITWVAPDAGTPSLKSVVAKPIVGMG